MTQLDPNAAYLRIFRGRLLFILERFSYDKEKFQFQLQKVSSVGSMFTILVL